MRTLSLITIFLLLIPFATRAQEKEHGKMPMPAGGSAGVQKAVCVLYPIGDNRASGTVTFTRTDAGVRVVADIKGLDPGKHGFHVHEFGDITSEDGSSAGGHYNPSGEPHAGPFDKMRHEGDMGNLEADANGNAHLDYVDPMLMLDGPKSIIGRSVVVHQNADDLKSQPAGNSGPRIAYGVIGIAK
ncbi:MAG TPA: superoxide dismutase family protein [Bacteroidales bacterium]|nr:superoxide dismutase family protein [Bacteroidales bacterium]